MHLGWGKRQSGQCQQKQAVDCLPRGTQLCGRFSFVLSHVWIFNCCSCAEWLHTLDLVSHAAEWLHTLDLVSCGVSLRECIIASHAPTLASSHWFLLLYLLFSQSLMPLIFIFFSHTKKKCSCKIIIKKECWYINILNTKNIHFTL